MPTSTEWTRVTCEASISVKTSTNFGIQSTRSTFASIASATLTAQCCSTTIMPESAPIRPSTKMDVANSPRCRFPQCRQVVTSTRSLPEKQYATASATCRMPLSAHDRCRPTLSLRAIPPPTTSAPSFATKLSCKRSLRSRLLA